MSYLNLAPRCDIIFESCPKLQTLQHPRFYTIKHWRPALPGALHRGVQRSLQLGSHCQWARRGFVDVFLMCFLVHCSHEASARALRFPQQPALCTASMRAQGHEGSAFGCVAGQT